ncbi:MAG: putative toxin-antitoxin system toxin component, PIN family [Nitrospirales bacterium]
MRVVFETNIYISALAIPGGNAEEAYLEAVRGAFDLSTSVGILTETARVLQTKFDWAEDKVREAVQTISQMAIVLRPRPTLHILDDEPDNRILECAIAAQAEFVVSGDRHLLALKHHADITMISLADFLTKLHR